ASCGGPGLTAAGRRPAREGPPPDRSATARRSGRWVRGRSRGTVAPRRPDRRRGRNGRPVRLDDRGRRGAGSRIGGHGGADRGEEEREGGDRGLSSAHGGGSP